MATANELIIKRTKKDTNREKCSVEIERWTFYSEKRTFSGRKKHTVFEIGCDNDEIDGKIKWK